MFKIVAISKTGNEQVIATYNSYFELDKMLMQFSSIKEIVKLLDSKYDIEKIKILNSMNKEIYASSESAKLTMFIKENKKEDVFVRSILHSAFSGEDEKENRKIFRTYLNNEMLYYSKSSNLHCKDKCDFISGLLMKMRNEKFNDYMIFDFGILFDIFFDQSEYRNVRHLYNMLHALNFKFNDDFRKILDDGKIHLDENIKSKYIERFNYSLKKINQSLEKIDYSKRQITIDDLLNESSNNNKRKSLRG